MENAILNYSVSTKDMVDQEQLTSIISTYLTVIKKDGESISIAEGTSRAVIVLPDLGVKCCVWHVVDDVLIPPPLSPPPPFTIPPPSPPPVPPRPPSPGLPRPSPSPPSNCSYPPLSDILSTTPGLESMGKIIASLPSLDRGILNGSSSPRPGSGCTFFAPSDKGMLYADVTPLYSTLSTSNSFDRPPAAINKLIAALNLTSLDELLQDPNFPRIMEYSILNQTVRTKDMYDLMQLSSIVGFCWQDAKSICNCRVIANQIASASS
jgi:hypothetical protein